MGGGLMQLVAYGAQDIYLTGNPQITFFKVVYRRHTNFSMEAIEQTINGTQKSSASATSGTVTVSRNGDLVHKVYVTSSTESIENGSAIVSEVELEIGGQRIDKHYQEWNEIWNELSTHDSKAQGLKAMTGCVGSSGTTGVGMVQVPLNFWFCRNPGLALPLIALQYHEVKLKFTWGTNSSVGADAEFKVIVDYIYLDTDERRRFAQQSHEYLIEQLQRQSETGSKSMKLNFNHPVKELIWTGDSYGDARLVLNGHDRFSKQEEEYFQLRQPFDHHTAVPGQNLPLIGQIGFSTASYSTNLLAKTVTGTSSLSSGEAEIENTEALTTGLFAASATAADEVTNGAMNGAPGTMLTGTVYRGNGCNTAPVYSFLTADLTLPTVGDTVLFIYSNDSGVTRKSKLVKIHAAKVGGGSTGNFSNAMQHLVVGTRIEAFDNATNQSTTIIYGIYARDSNDVHARTSQLTDKINCYSFALKPEEHQPSGTCNFSRIDTAKLNFESAPSGTVNIYAVNYNVLRIMSGMGGLAYSN